MRSIVHISDLHFGRVDPNVVEGLEAAIAAAKPDVIAVSGDLTQRARRRQFEAARRFLDRLPRQPIVIPGNHDVPLYNVFARWLAPLRNYRRYISNDLEPFYADSEVAILGINTARSLTIKNGRIGREQARRACERLAPLREGIARIVVTHHPFAVPEVQTRSAVLGRAKMAMAAFTDCKVDVVLSGHLHVSHAISGDTLYAGPHAALLVQAGTATSSRLRNEPNAFNILRVELPVISIERHRWGDGRFGLASIATFRREADGWRAAAATPG